MLRSTYIRAAMLLALVTPAATAAAQRRRGYDRDAVGRLDTTVAFTRSGSLNVNLPNGNIVVRGWDRDQVKVHATSEDSDGDIRFSASGSRATLEMGSYRSREGRFEITVPYGAEVSARAQSGDIDIRGTRGDVEAVAQSGDLHVEDVGRLDVNSLSGDIQVTGVNGDASVHSVSGDFHLDGVKGDVDVETVSGDLRITNAVSKFVRAHSVSGGVTYQGTIDPAGRYELSSHSGEIAVTVPQNASAQMTVSTWSGSIDSDFPITLKPGEHGFGLASTKKFTFQVGGGAARVNLESFSGDITIHSTQRR